MSSQKFDEWKKRKGQENAHNAPIPKAGWIEDWEKNAIIDYYSAHLLNGYRRITYMMLDENIVAVSPSSVYRILKKYNLLNRPPVTKTKKGDGFHQPSKPHAHWHIDVSYINICGTFYYLCCVLDGFSRYIVHHEIREAMKEQDIEIILQRAVEKHPGVTPRIISDNGPQFISKDFKEFVRISGMDHVRTSPFYPQSNGKLERFHGTIKKECIRPKSPVNLIDARDMVIDFINSYNTVRLHSAIGYIAPIDKLEGRADEILKKRMEKLQKAKEKRFSGVHSVPLKTVNF